jgi:uncharacterized protein
MAAREFRVAYEAGGRVGEVSARRYEARGEPLAWLVLAPGAGAGHDHRFMVAFGSGLAARGLHLVTFNFPYIEHGRRVPDPTSTLEACWLSVLHAVAGEAGPGARLFAGGKSMGGRIASQVAAHVASETVGARRPAPPLHGLVFLGYPLHPPGRPEQLRTAHWPSVRVPTLFIQGTRDLFASPEELRAQLPRLGADASLLIVEGGDHSFAIARKAGRTQEEVCAEVQDAIAAWIRAR